MPDKVAETSVNIFEDSAFLKSVLYLLLQFHDFHK